MEGSNWLRVGGIVLLVLGAIYVLLPSWLAERDISVDIATTSAAEEPLELWFEAADADADAATAEAVQARLEAAGAPIRRVDVADGRVVVHLLPGAVKDEVAAALLADGAARQVAVYGPEAVGIDPSRLEGVEAGVINQAVQAATIAEGAQPLDVGGVTVTEQDGAVVASYGLATPSGPLIVAVDGEPVGWTEADADPADPTPVHLVGDADAARRSLLAPTAAPPELPEPLTRWAAPVAAPTNVPNDEAPEEAAEELTWWASLLPDTKLNLGLDLQGGIDLTLQVDQDAAVIGTVQRDRRNLQDLALKEGKEVEVRRDRTRFALQIASPMPYDQIRDWADEQLGLEYVYVESVTEDGKNWVVYELTEEVTTQLMDQAVEQNVETLRKRVDATGVKEPSIVKMSGGRINIQLPGVQDAQAATDAIGTQASLEFRMVHPDNTVWNTVNGAYLTEAREALPPDQFADIELLNDWMRSKDYLPEGFILLPYSEDEAGSSGYTYLPVTEDVELTGADIDNATVAFDQANIPRVGLDFKSRGASRFCEITTEHVGEQFAIVLDDEIRSAPRINEPICGGSASITMGNSVDALDDANTLALVLRTGSLSAPVDIGEVREIGASLGADAIRSGTYGALVGGAFTITFMFIWYGRSGLVADLALMVNVLLVFAFLALFGATLTLPGIAGIALTVGMAVDANIIIFERIREELKLGVTPRKAVDAGFDKALSAILDSNITTAIAGVVLYSFGTGPIKGFAVTLLIGIVTTLIAALFVTRTLMDVLTRRSSARLRL